MTMILTKQNLKYKREIDNRKPTVYVQSYAHQLMEDKQTCIKCRELCQFCAENT